VTPLGRDASSFADALFAGRSAIGRWKRVDERICSRIGGDLSEFDVDVHLRDSAAMGVPPELAHRASKSLRATPLAATLTAAAALEAFTHAGDLLARTDASRIGHVLGGHNLQLRYQHENFITFRDEPDFIDGLFGVKALDTDVLAVTNEILGLKGPSFTVGGACASSNVALIQGLDLLRSRRCDAVLVTGSAMDIDTVWLQGWVMIDALSYRSFNDEPQRASRPFDRRREGFVPSHGAGAVVLERVANAKKGNAVALAEILGGCCTSAASRSTRPDLESQVAAIRGALADAGTAPEEIDYVNAHATSTSLGDAVEVAAIKRVFEQHAYRIPVNATKSMIGHCLTSASILEAVATVQQMRAGRLHPTINLDNPDPELDLDFVPLQSRPHRIGKAISNAFGFGGINSCLVIGQPTVDG
jgi:3-oxoacyl-(acyl-carrier-protein) synthase